MAYSNATQACSQGAFDTAPSLPRQREPENTTTNDQKRDGGAENDRPSKSPGMKLTDMKMTDMKMTDMKMQDMFQVSE